MATKGFTFIPMFFSSCSMKGRESAMSLSASSDGMRPKRISRSCADAGPGNAAAPLAFEDLLIDRQRREVRRQGELVELTGTEFELLVLLAAAPGRVFSRDEILAHLRGSEADIYTRAVDILISRLRRKLEPLSCIKTLRNAGYAFALGRTP